MHSQVGFMSFSVKLVEQKEICEVEECLLVAMSLMLVFFFTQHFKGETAFMGLKCFVKPSSRL